MNSQQVIRVASIAEVAPLGPFCLCEWNVLSIRGKLGELPLDFPGARRLLTLYFDDVGDDFPEDHLFAAKPEDIEGAVEFSREIGDEPLLIQSYAGFSRSTALSWIILCDKLREEPKCVRQAFEIVRTIRPVMLPNRHVVKLGLETLYSGEARKEMRREFQACLAELKYPEPVPDPSTYQLPHE